ncbi:hypothetical protein ACFLQ0_01090 [Nitrospinota bacterium]
MKGFAKYFEKRWRRRSSAGRWIGQRGLLEEIQYGVRQDEGVIVLEFLGLGGTSTGMASGRFSPEEFEKRFSRPRGEKPGEKTRPVTGRGGVAPFVSDITLALS